MYKFAIVAVLAVAAIAEDSLPKPAARIAGGGNPNAFHIAGTRKLTAASHSGYSGEISDYLKKQFEKEAESKKNQPRQVLSVFTRTASMQSPWFMPRARKIKSPEQRLAELSEKAIPMHRRQPTIRTAHFF